MKNLFDEAHGSFRNCGSTLDESVERANAVIMAEAGIKLLKASSGNTDFKEIRGIKEMDSQGECKFTKSDCP